MTKGPIRRAQLIAPFGVGAMVIVKDGTSLITAGLDFWYQHEPAFKTESIDMNEFVIKEWRLQRLLQVSHFRNPPDFRKKDSYQTGKNYYLTVPFLRFPQWHFCLACNSIEELTLRRRDKGYCSSCTEKNKKTGFLVQVPVIAMCSAGHLQDFPWREWVHRTAYPSCNKRMELIATGSASLSAQLVKCGCKAQRNLGRIMEAGADDNQIETTYLSSNLQEDKQLFLCQGKKPWLGISDINICNNPLRATLRNASNVYFAQVKSAIYLPRRRDIPDDLISMLEKPPLSEIINILMQSGAEAEAILKRLKRADTGALTKYTDNEISSAIQVLIAPAQNQKESHVVIDDDEETAFRRTEFEVLTGTRDEEILRIRQADLKKYDPKIAKYFSRVMLVDKLRETRVLSGFTRVFAEGNQTAEQQRALLWRNPQKEENDWLPGYVVYGEGIFFEFNEQLLKNWESKKSVQMRIANLAHHYNELQQERHWRARVISPRFVLLHTFSHLLINRLIYDCGYSTASLREKLYVSSNKDRPMAGVLIYTAAGDTEGSMGGLVKMGEKGIIEPVIMRSLDDAKWCSADPVCMEMGSSGGQGPFSCNLAACHNCCLLPETACEEFNRFLDRGLLIGSIEDQDLKFFI